MPQPISFNVGFEVLTAVILKNSILRDMTPYTAYYLLHAGFFLALFFDTEEGSEMFLGNVC
jgi:hypothetical protein